MTIVKGALQFTGGIKGASFYTRKGSDKVIMRTSDIEQLQQHPITKFQALVPELQGVSTTVISDWFSTEDVIEAQTLQLSLNEELRKYLTTNVTLLLSVGVQFGKVAFAGEIVPVKHAGCGKTVMSL